MGALADGVPSSWKNAVGEGANRRTRGRVRSPDRASYGSSIKMRHERAREREEVESIRVEAGSGIKI
jgi:hypothetical protein